MKFTDNEVNDLLKFVYEQNIDDTEYIDGFVNILKNGIPSLNDIQRKNIHDFYLNHKSCCKEKLGKDFYSTTGGGFATYYTWTPIGFIIKYKCNSCGKTLDISDYTELDKNYAEFAKKNPKISYKNAIKIQHFSLQIVGTGLGCITTITCIDNNKNADVTDTSGW